MEKRLSSMLIGGGLILIGLAGLAGNLILTVLGVSVRWWEAWRLWPVMVVSLGLVFVALPILAFRLRGFGAFFIPGVPILVTGGILLFASTFDKWGVWEYLWPLEVLALASGFLLAALFTRVIWLVIPAVIIGLNGLVLQFCAITGLWSAWAVLWVIEPLAIGLSLFLVSFKTRSTVVFTLGFLFCGFAAIALFGMTAILSGWLFRLIGPLLLILVGLLALLFGIVRRPTAPAPVHGDSAA